MSNGNHFTSLCLRQARIAGIAAGKRGTSQCDNPFWQYSALWYEWFYGWREGRREQVTG